MRFPVTIIILNLIAAPFSNAQDEVATAAAPPQFPCQDREEFRQFDFWLGEWVVHVANGTLAGKNRIEKSQAGCMLMENWVGTTDIPGMSINYFDIATKEWVQVWVSASGTQIDMRGGLTDDGMLLEGQINYVGNESSAPFRALWTLLPDGRVRQFMEQSNDGGQTWAPWFEGFYTRTGTEQQSSTN